MRITGGKAARRILKAPKGLDVRAHSEISSSRQSSIRLARGWTAPRVGIVCRLGALSLDCLSRGAASALCVEKSHRHAEFIRNNAAAAGFGEILEVRTQDVFPVMHQLAESGRRFELILADPPYGEKNVNRRSTSFAQQLLDEPHLPRLLAPGGRFVLGHTKRDTLEIASPWIEVKRLRHGDSVMLFLEIGGAASTGV